MGKHKKIRFHRSTKKETPKCGCMEELKVTETKAPETLGHCTGGGCGPTPYVYQPACVGGNCRDDIPTVYNPNTVVSQSPTFTAISTSASGNKLSGALIHHTLMTSELDKLQAAVGTSTGDDLAHKFRHCIKVLAKAHNDMHTNNHNGATAMSGGQSNTRQVVANVLESNNEIWNGTIAPSTATAKATLQQLAQLAIAQGIPCSYVNTLFSIIDKNGDQAHQIALALRDHLHPYTPVHC